MKFTVPQCIERLKNPVNTAFIAIAQKQEERLTMHIESITQRARMPEAFREFLAWVESFLPKDKFQRFEQLMKFPLETVDFTKSIFTELSKYADAPDGFTKFDFSIPELEKDFLSYLNTNLNDENFWSEKGFEALKTAINSFLVVDLPPVQAGPRPEPYYYLLSIKAVKDVVINERTGALEYLVFLQKDGSAVFIDEIAYRRFIRRILGADGNWIDLPEWRLEDEKIHSTYVQRYDGEAFVGWGDLVEGLGYVPACSFYELSVSGTGGIEKTGPLTNALGALDKLLFKIVSQDYFELYGSYPIVLKYKEACHYRDEEGNECNSGFINYTVAEGDGFKNCQKQCPVCAKNSLLGAGSQLEVDPPATAQDADLLKSGGVRFVEPTTDLLEFGIANILAKKKEIFTNAVGYYQEATKEAINEKQVQSQFEAREAILNTIREQMDSSRLFVLETIARLRYGNRFVSGNVYGGKEYFLSSAEEINLQYQDAKKSGLPSYVLERLRQTYIKTKFRNNPAQEQRMFILGELEPYPDFTVSELKNLGLDLRDPEGFTLKVNFVSFVKRFERENTNVVLFASLRDFDTKIEIIRGRLLQYAGEAVAAAPKPEPAQQLQ